MRAQSMPEKQAREVTAPAAREQHVVERATWRREVNATENAGRTPKGHLEVDTMQLSVATERQLWGRGLKGTYGMKVSIQQNLVNLAYGEEKPVLGRCQSRNTFPEPSLPHHTREDSPVSKSRTGETNRPHTGEAVRLQPMRRATEKLHFSSEFLRLTGLY